VHFKVRTGTQLKKLMEAYSARQSLQVQQVLFHFGGKRVLKLGCLNSEP